MSRAVERYKSGEALCDFTAADGVRHRVWKVSGEERIRNLEEAVRRDPGGPTSPTAITGRVGGEGVLETAGGASRLHGGGAVQLLPLRPVSPRPAADPALQPGGDGLEWPDGGGAAGEDPGELPGGEGGKEGRVPLPAGEKGRVRHAHGGGLVPAGDEAGGAAGGGRRSGAQPGRIRPAGVSPGAGSLHRRSPDQQTDRLCGRNPGREGAGGAGGGRHGPGLLPVRHLGGGAVCGGGCRASDAPQVHLV